MIPRITPLKSVISHFHLSDRLIPARLRRTSPKVTFGAAAAAAIAVAGVATAVSIGSAPAAATGSSAADIHAAAASAAPAPASHKAPAKPAEHQAPAKHAAPAKHQAPAKPKAPAKPASHQAPARHKAPARHNYRIYDSVTPSALPAHNAIATYATGNYAASPSQVAGHKTVMWIDTTGYHYAASVLDVEPGDATPAMAGSWAWHRLHASPRALARLYTMRSEWPAVKAAVAKLPANMRSHIRYWIADPTGVPHIVPGSSATQWYWGSSVDISTATPRFG